MRVRAPAPFKCLSQPLRAPSDGPLAQRCALPTPLHPVRDPVVHLRPAMQREEQQHVQLLSEQRSGQAPHAIPVKPRSSSGPRFLRKRFRRRGSRALATSPSTWTRLPRSESGRAAGQCGRNSKRGSRRSSRRDRHEAGAGPWPAYFYLARSVCEDNRERRSRPWVANDSTRLGRRPPAWRAVRKAEGLLPLPANMSSAHGRSGLGACIPAGVNAIIRVRHTRDRTLANGTIAMKLKLKRRAASQLE